MAHVEMHNSAIQGKGFRPWGFWVYGYEWFTCSIIDSGYSWSSIQGWMTFSNMCCNIFLDANRQLSTHMHLQRSKLESTEGEI